MTDTSTLLDRPSRPEPELPWPAVLVRAVVPERPTRPVEAGAAAPGAPSEQVPGALRPMVTVTLLVALLLVGHYGAFTYITRLGAPAGEVLPGGIGSLCC